MTGTREKAGSLRSWIGTLIAAAILWSAASLAAYHAWIHGAPHSDFYPRWGGVRLLIGGKTDLYSETATREIQRIVYGRELPAGDDQQGFAYPGLLVPIILPFCLHENVEVSTSAWTGFSFLLLLVTLHSLLSLRAKADLPEILLLSLWPYTLLSLFQGQVSILVLASLALGYRQVVRGRQVLGGLLLSVSLVKPELALLPLVFLFLSIPGGNGVPLLIGYGTGVALLLGLSVILMGWWIPDWLGALSRYADYAQVAWLLVESRQLHPAIPPMISFCVLAALVAARRRQDLLFALAVPAQLLLFPQTLMWCLTLLTIPLALAFRGRRQWLVFFVWGLAWYCLLLDLGRAWWKLQVAWLSLVCVFVIAYLGIQPSRNSETVEA
jgi:hypothetical protein